MPKATKLEQATRIETVRQLILSGHEHGRICQQVSEKWNISERQARRYLSQAQAIILEVVVPGREYMLAEHMSVRRDIRRRAREAGDLRAEIAAAQDECKLFGLYPAVKLEVDDLRDKPDSDLINEFQSIVDAARARTSNSNNG